MKTDNPFEFVNPASGCAKCPELIRSRHTVVWGRGPAQADFMVIGESPGYNEDLKGLPFVGRSGRLLDKVLDEAGLRPQDVHVTNVILCHPSNDRDPQPDELDNCRPWLVQHIRDVNPKGVMLVGRFAIASKFQAYTVQATQGLMLREECDGCGELDSQHGHRFAQDGSWTRDNLGICDSDTRVVRRVYAATYHPAARMPDAAQHIHRELTRLIAEVALL